MKTAMERAARRYQIIHPHSPEVNNNAAAFEAGARWMMWNSLPSIQKAREEDMATYQAREEVELLLDADRKGKTIQFKSAIKGEWMDMLAAEAGVGVSVADRVVAMSGYEMRIKPEESK